MPALILTTNVKIEGDTLKAFIIEFSKVSAEILSKPEYYIQVCYQHNETLTFSGTFEPTFNLHITSLDNINPDVNQVYSAKFSEFLKEKLGLESDRGYITFYDPGREYLGFKGATF
ncbi:hypothetical protein FRC02_009890 [Tulasnella sp. 418]|nr:hypothetical protein FRC02_009890 [Tulasnella sp. 418]